MDHFTSYDDYVAGWLDSSILDIFDVFPRSFSSIKFVLITCLDSEPRPADLLESSPALRSVASQARILRSGLLLPTKALLQDDVYSDMFFGFDEVWFFPHEISQPKPDASWLVGPGRIDQAKLDAIGEWMANNSCTLALGDGNGLNFVVKARGLFRYLLGHSLDQPQPEPTFAASSTNPG